MRAPADPGLQPERTVLAWGRTLLAVGVLGASFLRWVAHLGMWVVLLSLVAIGISMAIYATQRRRYRRQTRGIHRERLHADPASVIAISCAVALMSVLAGAIVLWV